MINPQKPVINPIKNFNRFTALIYICVCIYIYIYIPGGGRGQLSPNKLRQGDSGYA